MHGNRTVVFYQPSTTERVERAEQPPRAARHARELDQVVGERRAGAPALELLGRDRAPLLVDDPRRVAVDVVALEVLGPQASGAWRGRAPASQVTTSTSVSLNSECSLRFAEPIASHSSSTMPILACT